METKPYHHENLKRELLERGIELVNEYGINQFSLRKVAQTCNVSHAAPYSHFKNKEELLSAMQSFITEQFSNALEETILKYKNTPVFLLEFGKTYISYFINNPQHFTFLFQQTNMQLDFNLDSEEKSNFKPFLLYKEQVLKMLEHSGIPDNKRQDFLIALWTYVHGLASVATMKNVQYSENWNEKITDLIEMFVCEF